MMKDDCIFCKLANGVFETNVIYEDEDFSVILDVNPATRGHALILPREHYANIYEIDDETAGQAFRLARKLCTQMTEKLNCDGFNILQNNGEAAGQTVFHFHMHLIPRYKDDKALLQWKPGKPSEDELKTLRDMLKTK